MSSSRDFASGRISESTKEQGRLLIEEAFGPEFYAVMRRKGVTDIFINNDQTVWCMENGEKKDTGIRMPYERTLTAINILATTQNRIVNAQHPSLDARLPTGERVLAMVPGTSLKGSTVAIRIPQKRVYALEEFQAIEEASLYSKDDFIDHQKSKLNWGIIRQSIVDRENFVIAGGTGGGKTSLANAIINEPDFKKDRLLKMEDHPELTTDDCPHIVEWWQGTLSMRDLVKSAMRAMPDRIIIGEVRDGAAYDWVDACNTGHTGNLLTVHAKDPEGVIQRMMTLVKRAEASVSIEEVVGAIDVIICMARNLKGRRGIVSISKPTLVGGTIKIVDLATK